MDNPYSNLVYKNRHQWHAFWVFQDQEFQCEVTTYLEKLLNINALRANSNNPNSLVWRKKQANYMIKEKRKICDKYVLSDEDFALYVTRHDKYPKHKMEGAFSRLVDIKISHIDGNIAVRFKPSISKIEYTEAWGEIKGFIEYELGKKLPHTKPTKRKQEVDYRLIYAIFRQRAKGKSYPAIHSLYLKGELPNYPKGKRNRLKTPKELNDYYLRNSAFKA